MENRYHKEVGFDQDHQQDLIDLIHKFNGTKRYGRTKHAFHRLNERFDYISILNYLANKVEFHYGQVFEYYVKQDSNLISKVCFRIEYPTSPYETQDLILVLTRQKDIVTLYINTTDDNHRTLKRELYTEVAK
jgi:hypothetical protein